MYNGMISLRPQPVYIRVQDLGDKPPGIHMAVYDTYIYNYQIYSNRGGVRIKKRYKVANDFLVSRGSKCCFSGCNYKWQ